MLNKKQLVHGKYVDVVECFMVTEEFIKFHVHLDNANGKPQQVSEFCMFLNI